MMGELCLGALRLQGMQGFWAADGMCSRGSRGWLAEEDKVRRFKKQEKGLKRGSGFLLSGGSCREGFFGETEGKRKAFAWEDSRRLACRILEVSLLLLFCYAPCGYEYLLGSPSIWNTFFMVTCWVSVFLLWVLSNGCARYLCVGTPSSFFWKLLNLH